MIESGSHDLNFVSGVDVIENFFITIELLMVLIWFTATHISPAAAFFCTLLIAVSNNCKCIAIVYGGVSSTLSLGIFFDFSGYGIVSFIRQGVLCQRIMDVSQCLRVLVA